MRELRPRRDPARAWPQLLLLVVALAVAATMLAVGLSPEGAHGPRPWLGLLLTIAVLAAAGIGAWSLYAAPRRLDYRVRGRTLLVSTLLSQRRLPFASIRSAEVLRYDLLVLPGARLGWGQSHLPGYYVGWWRVAGAGVARVIVASPRGTGVLLRLRRGRPLLLAPNDPGALVALLQRHQGPGRDAIRSGS